MLKALIVLLVVIVGILVFASTKPDTFTVQRTATINAPAAKIYPLIADFHNWSAWSPWEHLDPNMQKIYGGPPSGTGATYAWEGNSKAGKGAMEITSASVPSQVTIKLDFLKPFKTSNNTVFTLEPQGDATTVTWVMTGPSPFLSKLMQVFTTMDKMIGGDFDRGLANLKAVAEK